MANVFENRFSTLIKWAWYGAPGQAKRLTRLFKLQRLHLRRMPFKGMARSDPQAQPCRTTRSQKIIGQPRVPRQTPREALARRIYFDLSTYNLVPTNRFGARDSSSTLDAGLVLLHDV